MSASAAKENGGPVSEPADRRHTEEAIRQDDNPVDQDSTAAANAPLLLTTGRFDGAWPPDAGDRATKQEPPARLSDVLSLTYSDDRHFVAYAPVRIEQPDYRGWFRLKGAALDVPGAKISVTVPWLVFDVDGPDHQASVEWRSSVEARLPAGVLWYPTSNGLRLMYQLAEPITVASRADEAAWQDYYETCCNALERTTAIVADRGCKDLWRLYRLPRTNREGRTCPVPASWVPSAPTLWDESLMLAEDEPKVSSRARRVGEPSGDVEDTLLCRLLVKADWEFGDTRGEWTDILCPWHEEHTTQASGAVDSSTSIRGNDDAHPTGPGVFRCLHGHCRDRSVRDVLELNRFKDFLAELDAAKRQAAAQASAAMGDTTPAPDAEPAPSAGAAHPTEDHSHCVLSPLSGWPYILQRGSRYYFHDIDRASYTRSYSEGELLAAVARHLNNQVAETCRSLNDLRAFYIRPIQYVLDSYIVRAGTFDPEADTLTQAACRWMPESRARYHADVDRWLRAMFTPVDYELVEMWLAASVALEKPAPLLALIGPALHGKSLFADGLARLWSRSKAAMMSEAFGEFNEAVGYCPLIFADEEIPGDMTFAWLREAITSRTRRVNRKGVSATDVLGCCRMILAANNDQVFRFAKMGVLTAADRDAIERRLLVVDVQPGAVDVLRESDTEAIADHRLAEHVLWLAQTVPVLGPGERMAAPANDGKRMLGPVLFNRQADVLARLRELLDTNGVIGGGTHPAVVRAVDGEQGEVWVNVARVFDTFRGSVGSRVSRTDIGDVCESHRLRGPEQHQVDGANVRWRVLSLASLEAAFAGLD